MASRKKSALSARSSSTAQNNGAAGYSSEEDASDPYSSAFDPASFKVVQLRSLLHSHDVSVRSNARKADLIQAYEDEIRPRSEELKAARNRDRNIRPKAEDVIDMSVSRSHPIDTTSMSEREEEAVVSANESDVSLPSALLRADSPRRGRRSVSWAEDVSGPEDDESEDKDSAGLVGDTSNFSVNNPFQSPKIGASPPKKVAGRKSEPVPKRQSPVKQNRPSATPNMFRNYMDPSISSSVSPRKIGNDATKVKNRVKSLSGIKDDDSVESGAEGDVSRDGYESPSSPLRKRRSSKLSKSSSKDWEDEEKTQTARSIVWLLLAISTLIWWCWYAAESRAVGFCDVGRQSNALLDERARVQVQSRLAIEGGDENANVTLSMPNLLRPSCTPCPPHARCLERFLLGCESTDYVLQKPFAVHLPFTDFLLPLSMTAPTCRPDEQKVLLAADLADEVESRLRIHKGDIQCRRKVARAESMSKGLTSAASHLEYSLPKDVLHRALFEEVSKGGALVGQPEDYFEELWSLAIEDLHQTDRIGEEFRGEALLYAKRGATGVDVRCRSMLLAEDAWHRTRLWVALISVVLASTQWLRYRWRTSRTRDSQAKDLIAATLGRLEQEKKISDGYLSISQLRDDILRDETSEVQRKKLWSAVVKKVEGNSNVRTRQARVKGEWSRVWEWVGSTGGTKKGMVPEPRNKSRVSAADEQVVNEGKNRLKSAEI